MTSDSRSLESTEPHTTGDEATGSLFAGRFKLREKFGEGGMGKVYVADQLQPVQRRVALKVLKAELDSTTDVARFEQERQALALMDHPNIAKVFDGGTDEQGRPFLVMELVKGLPITEYCDQEKLTPKQRLELFLPVCEAVQHAHQKGIIHRDLKPSNILIALYDGKPVPKVIDFGLAKAIGRRLAEDTIYTQAGAMVGTLEYMAPEQAELNNLDIDTRADIYSLGVVLYELLTGSPPFTRKQLQSAAFAEILRLIKEVEPPKPSTKLSSSAALPQIAAQRKLEPQRLTKTVRGELDWIVMKCLEKERSRRYETASGLAQDIERYLSDEPVLAGPPTIGYRLGKFVRRNRGPVLAGVLVILALVIGTAGMTWGMIRAERMRQAAVQETDEKTKALAAESRARARARQALDDMTSQVIDDWLARQDTLAAPQQAFLQSALEQYEEFAAEAADDPDAQLGVADAQRRVGDILHRLGRPTEAMRACAEARNQFARLAAARPGDSRVRAGLVRAQLSRVRILFGRRHDEDEAESAELELLAEAERFVKDSPLERTPLELFATALRDRAIHLSNARRFQEALTVANQAAAAWDRLNTERPDDAAGKLAKARLLGLQQPVTHEKAAEILGLYEDAAGAPAPLPEALQGAGRMRLNLGIVHSSRGDIPRAVEEFTRSERWFLNLIGMFPGVPEYRLGLGQLYLVWARAARRGDRPEAADLAQTAFAIWDRLARLDPDSIGYAHGLASAEARLAEVHSDAGRLDQALTLFGTALDRYERIIATAGARDHTYEDLGELHVSRAKTLDLKEKHDLAADDWSKAAEYAEKRLHPDWADRYFARRAISLVRAERQIDGIDEAERLAAKPNLDSNTLVYLASAYGWAARSGHGDPARVVELLRRSNAEGFLRDPKLLEELRTAPDFEAVRDRADFQALLAELSREQAAPQPNQ